MDDCSLAEMVGRRSIMAFGDSITQQAWNPVSGGWVAKTAWAYERKADVINRGLSGFNSRQGRAALKYIFPPAGGIAKNFAITTIFFGANDATDASSAACQHVPLDEFEDNVAAIAERALEVSELVLVMAPPVVDHRLWPDRNLESARAYGLAAQRAVARVNAKLGTAGSAAAPASISADETGLVSPSSASPLRVDTAAPAPGRPILVFVDLYTLCLEYKGATDASSAEEPAWHALLSDGLHLSPAGNNLVFEAVMGAVRTHAPHLAPEALDWDLPYWKSLGNESPQQVREALSIYKASPKSAGVPPIKPGDGVCCCGKH